MYDQNVLNKLPYWQWSCFSLSGVTGFCGELHRHGSAEHPQPVALYQANVAFEKKSIRYAVVPKANMKPNTAVGKDYKRP